MVANTSIGGAIGGTDSTTTDGASAAGATPGTILDRIVARTRVDVAERRARVPVAELRAEAATRPAPIDMAAHLAARRTATGLPAVIAEVKKASPSKGVLRADFDPVAIALAYREAGAAAISVLTDAPFFQGSLDNLRAVRAAIPDLPLLRKDFIVEEYQLEEARGAGADAVLLIAACLGDPELARLHAAARALGLSVLVEAYSEGEVDRCLRLPELRLLGINNRDLRTFDVDLDRTRRGFERIPAALRHDVLLVSESGLANGADVRTVAAAGARAILVGEHFVRQPDPGAALAALRVAAEPAP
jgi:indole-3-glycerol phosphate synthase